MIISESRIRRIIREEIQLEIFRRAAPQEADDGLRSNIALVLACFTGKPLGDFTVKQHGLIVKSFPKGNEIRDVADHYGPISHHVFKYLRGIEDDQFVTLPDEFIPTLVDEVQRKNPSAARRLLDEYRREDDVDWYSEFELLAAAAQSMSDWITGSQNYNNAHDYLDGFEIMLNRRNEIERFVDLMRAGPPLVRFLSTADDDDMIDKIIELVISGPDGTIQAGELARSLGEM